MKRLSRNRKFLARAPQEATWAVSYGDMITLLLGFYIMYFSIDPPKKGNTTLTTSLIAALEKMDEGVSIDQKKRQSSETTEEKAPSISQPEKPEARDSEAGNAVVERITATKQTSEKRGTDKKMAVQDDTQTAMQTIMQMVLPKDWIEKINKNTMSAKSVASQSPEPLAPAMHAQTQDVSKEGAPTGSSTSLPKAAGYRPDVTEIKALDAEASRIGDRVYIMFPKVSFFASASTEITPEGRQALEKFAKVYMPFAGKALLNIVGFSDERPVKAVYRFRDNLELSVLRAVSAQRVAESVGIPLGRTRLMGHGINTSLVEGEAAATTVERWALTRKIMLVIEPEVQ
ncbi:MAG TPA: OmpA family protein [Oligoflexus sp.]|uniref:flagellar motor protein MotB n=1 Tax=Oligoflexus sp. TaxID=1971216 RepID=UPI002D64D84F|nr:OmpA family protein [Oligoflexus sp.]HYX35869.1 OmpA family protein [Oligoflexus sp.]